MLHTEQERHEKVRTVFLLDPAERKALEQLSDDTGAPVSELLRRSVSSYLQNRDAQGGAGQAAGRDTQRPNVTDREALNVG